MEVLIVAALVLLALVAVVLYLLEKFVPKSRLRSKSSLISTILFIIFIVLLIVTIVLVNLAQHGVDEENMKEIIEKTSLILAKSRNLLETNTIVELYWPDVIESINKISDKTSEAHGRFIGDIEFDHFSEAVRSVYETKVAYKIEDCDMEAYWMNDLLANIPDKCGMQAFMTNAEIRSHFVTIKDIMRPTLEVFLKNEENELTIMKNGMLNVSEEQKKLDFGKSTTENGLITMKNMIQHFQSDINKSDTTKQEWHLKMRELATFWITENIVKILVNVVCVILIILSIISIISLYRPSIFCQNNPSKLMLILSIVTVILTILVGLIVLILSIGTVGQFDCPLNNDTFGMLNFTSSLPDPYRNQDLSVCRSSTFFSGILPFITFEDIEKNLKINEFTEKMLAIPMNLHSSDFPTSLSQELVAIENVRKWFDDLAQKNCFTTEADQLDIQKFRDKLGSFLRESEKCEVQRKTYNEKLLKNDISFAYNIKMMYEDIVPLFEDSIGPMNNRISLIDFPCEPIVGNFSSVGHRICKQFDSPLDTYSIFNIITILACLVALILLAIAYINSRSPNIPEKSMDKDDKSLDPSMSPSVTPTTNIK